MARGYLAIQGSAVASERAFTSGKPTGTALCNRFNSQTFEALQLLKDAYRAGVINATEKAKHYADLAVPD